MRVGINTKLISGPFGGANQFALSLETFLQNRGHQVFRHLADSLDLILIIAAQPNLQICAFDSEAIAEYRMLNPNTVVVIRVNTCDAQRGADLGIDELYFNACGCADYAVFVSRFMETYCLDRGLPSGVLRSIIHNGAEEMVYNPEGCSVWDGEEPLRLVTHHWSSNYLKGFDIYERFDQMLAGSDTGFAFTIVGNLPHGMRLKNTTVVESLSGKAMADELKKHHAYLTAARHEPAGNHYVEAMQCGLPVLHLDSGSLPEYCGEYGITFTLANFDKKLQELKSNYSVLKEKASSYSWNAQKMCAGYENLFCDLVTARQQNPLPEPGLGVRCRHLFRRLRKKAGRLRRRAAGILAG